MERALGFLNEAVNLLGVVGGADLAHGAKSEGFIPPGFQCMVEGLALHWDVKDQLIGDEAGKSFFIDIATLIDVEGDHRAFHPCGGVKCPRVNRFCINLGIADNDDNVVRTDDLLDEMGVRFMSIGVSGSVTELGCRPWLDLDPLGGEPGEHFLIDTIIGVVIETEEDSFCSIHEPGDSLLTSSKEPILRFRLPEVSKSRIRTSTYFGVVLHLDWFCGHRGEQ